MTVLLFYFSKTHSQITHFTVNLYALFYPTIHTLINKKTSTAQEHYLGPQ